MTQYSLLQQLDNPKVAVEESSNINYQQYELLVDNKTQAIKIPIREAESFELAVGQLSEKITKTKLRQLLRSHRGIRS